MNPARAICLQPEPVGRLSSLRARIDEPDLGILRLIERRQRQPTPTAQRVRLAFR